MKSFVFFLITFLSSVSLAQVSLETTLFGVEYTFQDMEMVNEPGRNTGQTEHKKAKMKSMLGFYLDLLGLEKSRHVERRYGYMKRGFLINVPGDGIHIINMEPVTIEFNTTPRILGEIRETAQPIFEAARSAELIPYVNPAGLRSGMGHVHVGGKTLGDSPFFQNPLLLRNLLVYVHQHPSVLFGLSEAFDLGMGSNIETYHFPKRQRIFQKAIEEFDAWWKRRPGQRQHGFQKFLEILEKHDSANNYQAGFFEKFRLINLVRLQELFTVGFSPDLEGPYTVEFRNLRPPKSPEYSESVASFLVSLMNHLSEPGMLVPFRWVEQKEYDLFMSPQIIKEDWAQVNQDLEVADKNIHAMVKEYVDSVDISNTSSGVRVAAAFSEKEFRGTWFEMTAFYRGESSMEFAFDDQRLKAERVRIEGVDKWIAVTHAPAYNWLEARFPTVKPLSCESLLGALP